MRAAFPNLSLVALGAALLTTPAGATSADIVPLWDPAVPFPETHSDIPPVPFATYSVVQTGEAGVSQYLHEAGIEWFGDLLYTGWSSARRDESATDKMIAGRYSRDGGRTWSERVTIAPEVPGRDRREYAAFAEHEGRLWLFTTRIHSGWEFAEPRLELFVMGDSPEVWDYRGIVLEDNFVATDKPRRLDNGRWILAGMYKDTTTGRRIGRNRIALSAPNDLTRWTVSGIEHPEGMRFPFVSLIVEGRHLTAILRNSLDTFAMVSTSADYGETWTPAQLTNIPMTGVKPFAGVLSTGQRFLVACTPAERGNHLREALTLLVSEPGQPQFSRIWRISRGRPHPMRFEGRGKGPGPGQWSYPKAVEHDGNLYVIYTVNKEDAELAIIPINSLK